MKPNVSKALPKIVSTAEWQIARDRLLAKEKAHTRAGDALAAERRRLPMVEISKAYQFDGASGKATLLDLFEARRQLIVYHFMFAPNVCGWPSAGCDACSWYADNVGDLSHLHARDTSFVMISRAPLPNILAYKKRMGWSFNWVSSAESDFNYDYQMSHKPEAAKNGTAYYNYGTGARVGEEMPGVSVFYKDRDGDVYHTYSTYSRGIDLLNGAYNYIDLTPKGRDEGNQIQTWVRRHDQYED